ncbi:hypothetical protein HQQ80_12600 [Microbacteriaceae bacterium VKM Ac-2855]|nr:hypothetical protein [Microbacteriaceae bacterium VKM Ac-2855]
MRRGMRPVLAACAALLLGGCAAGYTAPPKDPIAAARALPDASGTVSVGDASCGEFELDQGEEVPAEAVACLVEATGEAEIAWTTPTTEGDPIVNFAQVDDAFGGVYVYRTTAFDSYGGDGYSWTMYRCADRSDLGAADDCEELFEG